MVLVAHHLSMARQPRGPDANLFIKWTPSISHVVLGGLEGMLISATRPPPCPYISHTGLGYGQG